MVKDWGNRPICRIDVTGFLSIQVGLLFMFLAPGTPDAHNSRTTVDLLKAHHAVSVQKADYDDALIISILRDGKIYFHTESVQSGDRLWIKLQERVRSGSEKRVYINADARAKCGVVNWVLDQIRQTGIEDVSLLTQTPR